jgi:hypothetical protein
MDCWNLSRACRLQNGWAFRIAGRKPFVPVTTVRPIANFGEALQARDKSGAGRKVLLQFSI